VGAAIQMPLGREGCDTIHAPDAGRALRAFVSGHFDLAIIDIFLPDVDGLKTIAEFRRRAPAVPILAMSGFRFRDSMDPVLEYLALASKAAAAACLRKPFAPAVNASLASSSPVLES
jgi:DNA-binding response OmpR family regulator